MALRRLTVACVLALALVMGAAPAEAGIVHGLMSIVGGVLQVPFQILAGTLNGPPILGTVSGILSGTLQGTGMILGGTWETAMGAVDLAKTYAPYVLPFLL